MNKLMIFCILSVILSSSCNSKLVYSIGTKNATKTNLKNVTMQLTPKGFTGGGIMAPNICSWTMYVTKWPVPEKVVVLFDDAQGNNHKLSIKTGLPQSFRGDILIIIKKRNGQYYIEIQTGKLDVIS